MIFNGLTTQHYRRNTEAHQSNQGITIAKKRCVCCKEYKTVIGGKVKRGTSRHNPEQFTCEVCLPKG